MPETVDLDNISGLVEETIELNPDANPMEAPPPPADGTHRVKLIMKPDSWESGTTKEDKQGNKRTYLKCQFSGSVVAEGSKDNNKRIFGRVNTLTFDGKNEMAYILLQVYGGSKNEQARDFVKSLKTSADLAKAFRDALAGEPIIRVTTKWTARYNAGTQEAQDWKTALSGMNNFPSDGAGGRKAVVNVKGHGDVAAQAEIQDYLPDVG